MGRKFSSLLLCQLLCGRNPADMKVSVRELVRFTDRNGSALVLGMTHMREASVQLVRDYAQSYTKYPFMIYQIQTKFRDEARPRAGLIRVREFIMKDAYSFHTSQADLEGLLYPLS